MATGTRKFQTSMQFSRVQFTSLTFQWVTFRMNEWMSPLTTHIHI